MACQLKPGTPVFEPAAGQSQWWEGDPATFPLWDGNRPHPHIVMKPHLLERKACQVLVECFERNRETAAARTGSEYWDGRYIWSNNLPRAEIEALRIMQQLRFYSTLKIMEAFRPAQFVYSDTAQLVRWEPGRELVPHADNIHPNGTPNGTAHRSFSSILYLNDTYEGGETYFPGHGIRIAPQPGTLVLFGAGCDYVHGVTKVRSGLRYTYAGWFTHDPNWEDAEARLVY